MGQVVEIPTKSFDREVKVADKPVAIEFWIRSCSNCQKFVPIYEKLPEIFGDKVKFLKMNMFLSLENLKMAEGFGVEETPTVKVFCKGKEIGEIVGYRSLEKIVKEIEEILEREGYCSKQSEG
jgi:thioredoxin-like negative regulator of GroEL